MIGQYVDNNNIQIKVLGFGQHISMGLNKGEVSDILKLSDAISKAVEKAEEMAGFRISNVTCNVSGGLPFTNVTTDNLQINGNLITAKETPCLCKTVEVFKQQHNVNIEFIEKLNLVQCSIPFIELLNY